MGRKLLIAAVLVCAVMAPALAYSQGPSIHAEDNAWVSSSGGNTLTIPVNTTVPFSYPSGASFHSVAWTSTAKPACTSGVQTGYKPADGKPPWSGTCRFSEVATYEFACNFHPAMTGTVTVVAATASPSPTATATATATPSPSPDPGTTTQPGTTSDPTQIEQTQGPLNAKVASAQKGTSVRGSVVLTQGSRLEVTVTLGKQRVGRYVKPAAAGGTKTFAVALDAKTRKSLKRKHSLKLAVTVAVTPLGAAKQSRAFSVRLRH